MNSRRLVPLSVLVLVTSILLSVPGDATAQQIRVFDNHHFAYLIPAAAGQEVRVTIVNPYRVDPNDPSATVPGFVVTFDRPVDPVTIGPGAAYTYTIDPRTDGVPVGQRSTVRHVVVTFSTQVAIEAGPPSPQVAVTIEVVNTRTGEVASFLAFPGFTGGVTVAAGDVD